MIIEKQKARATLLGRRKRAIIILALSFIVLLGACITINYFVRFVPFVDVDGTEYRIIRKAGKFALYDMDGNKLEPEDEYSYFVTQAGTLVDVNVDTGKTQVVAVVDTEYGESNDERNNLLIFPKVSRNELSSLESTTRKEALPSCDMILRTTAQITTAILLLRTRPLHLTIRSFSQSFT